MTGIEQKTNIPKQLLHIKYDCGVGVISDEWKIVIGEFPKVGATEFGTNCYTWLSLQACEDVDCHASRGIIDIIEPYSPERAKQLGLEG